jgi:cytochrome c-type biogenesis protein CcmF
MWETLPDFGTAVLCAILVTAGYTFAVALAAGSGRPRFLQAARKGAYGSVALVALAVAVLAFAFVTHDFRLDYVSRYSDRTMSVPWLVAALWGGQDGSLLWWLFLTAVFSGSAIWWLKGRYRELQPYIIATLMTVLMFMAILMLFAANPFRTLVSGAPPDGAGLNFQLRNFYMIIHPPSLYIGFTSCAVPFAFAIAALATGRLTNEWIVATRKWMLFSWLFLTIGNALGMLWAYEELGWGGYWAWDPVENAAFLPWLTATAYVHSVMLQERRGMLKMWNIILICLTFFLTYFGTFLTRSGLIQSVHSFAQSGIGIYFVYFMGLIIVVSGSLISYRAIQGRLKAKGEVESFLSRELTFLLNNWMLLILMFFIAGATVWPRISEWLFQQEATVSPPYYNLIIPPIALLLIFMMGTAPLLGWRKTSKELFYKSFRWPVAAMVAAVILHVAVGPSLGFPPVVKPDHIYGGVWGDALTWLQGKLPVVTVALVVYNIAVVVQEFQRGVSARRRGKDEEGLFMALGQLVAKSRRRYGGYIVHVGIAVMFFGFAGKSWEQKKELSMLENDVTEIGDYRLTYKGPRREVDHEKVMIFADLDVERNGKIVGKLSPAQFAYKDAGQQMSSEVDMFHTFRNDLYVAVGTVSPSTKRASFRFYINPLVNMVWLGVMIMLLGCFVAMWPEVSFQEAGAFGYVRALGSVASMAMMSVVLALAPSMAHAAQQQDMKRTGIVEQSETERSLFRQLLCNCGTCPKEALETCTCNWAHNARDQIREDLQKGMSPDQIREKYAAQHGEACVIV